MNWPKQVTEGCPDEIRKAWGWQPWNDMLSPPPTYKQLNFARDIAYQLHLNVDALAIMDKWAVRDFISNHIQEYNKIMAEHRAEYRRIQREYRNNRNDYYGQHFCTEVLGGDWGMDASDFGMQAWGDS